MKRIFHLTVALAALAACVSGCATMQTGILAGQWVRAGKANVPITMGWESVSHSHEMGDIMVTLPSGERYLGSYVRISDGV